MRGMQKILYSENIWYTSDLCHRSLGLQALVFRKIEVCARINLCGIRKLDLYTRKYKYSIDFLSSNNNSNNDDFGKFD